MSFTSRRFTLFLVFAVISLLVLASLGLLVRSIVGGAVESSTRDAASQTAFDTTHAGLTHNLQPSDLAGPMTGARYAAYNHYVNTVVRSPRAVHVKVWNSHGTVVYADERRIVGQTFPVSGKLGAAIQSGRLTSEVSPAGSAGTLPAGRLLAVYFPIRFHASGPIAGALEVDQPDAPVEASITALQRQISQTLWTGLLVIYALLLCVVGVMSRRIAREERRRLRHAEDLDESYRQTLAALAAAVSARDFSAEKHAARVTDLALSLGRWLKLPDAQLRDLERGALLHDVGKIALTDIVLLKSSNLSEFEWTQMRRHPEIGYYMLRDVPLLHDALPVVLHHHERWDGSGYPHGLKGEEIPLLARLFAVVDAYDAITSDRPYRAASSHEDAMNELRRSAGTYFDPSLVSAFDDMMRAYGPEAFTQPSTPEDGATLAETDVSPDGAAEQPLVNAS